MLEKLSERDRRAVKIGVVAATAILVFYFCSIWLGHWAGVRKSLSAREEALSLMNPGGARQKGTLTVVPVFEMPAGEEKQKDLFRNKLNEQLKKAGIKSKPMLFSSGKSPVAGYKLLRLKCESNCKFTQMLDLLANLKANPYLLGIEEIRIKCDEKKRKEGQIELVLTVSTLVKGQVKKQTVKRGGI